MSASGRAERLRKRGEGREGRGGNERSLMLTIPLPCSRFVKPWSEAKDQAEENTPEKGSHSIDRSTSYLVW